ncbi:MAG: cardiolipin synthase [Bacteroidales bacterium]|nr:cardiolipin synthase [Bacteroidales bacterium]
MFFEILYFAIIVSTIVFMIMENRNPQISIFWFMLIVMLPVVGLILFLFIGKDYRHSRVISQPELDQLTALRNQSNATTIAQQPSNDKYTKLSKMMCTANDSPLFNGNEVNIYTDFSSMFENLIADIRAAKHFVHIQFYIITDDEVGQQLGNLLIEKAREGVDVRLMFDSWANLTISKKFYNKLSEGGVKVQSFLKLIPSLMTRDVNCRTHRKIVVIDGHTGYTGGMNIAKRYRDGINNGVWRDTHIRLHGPAVSQLEIALLADWRFCAKELLAQSVYFPTIESIARGAQCQVVTSGPMDEWNTVMQGMVQIVAQSRTYLYLQTPYFIPTQPLLLALKNAALAGVDVRVMLPAKNDRSSIMIYASMSYFREAMQAGIKFYLYEKGFLHAKTMVCDDEFVTIGSTNIDSRSLEQNFEVNAFIYDSTIASHQRDIFIADQSACSHVKPDEWEHRPIWQRFIESLSRLLTPIL